MTQQDIVLVTGSYDNLIRFWRAAEQKCVATLDFETTVATLSVSPDRQYLAAGGHNCVRIYRIATQQQIHLLKPEQDAVVSQVLFSPASSYLHVASEDCCFKAVSTRDMKVVLSHSGTSAITCCACLTDSRVVVGDQAGRLLLFDVAATRPGPLARQQCFDVGVGVRSVDCHNPYICCCDGRGVLQVYRLGQGDEPLQLLLSVQAHSDQVNCCRFSVDGRYIVTVSSDRLCKAWEFDPGVPALRKTSQYVMEGGALDVCFNSSG